MTENEKKQIKRMREGGYSYGQIASELGLSKNTVKSHCRRHELSGCAQVEKKQELGDIVYCKYCGEIVIQNPGRKKKMFCNDSCRNKWWNTHQSQVDKKAYYEKTCCNCGKVFRTYGNANRKYCSHECYIENRFGKKEPVEEVEPIKPRKDDDHKYYMSKERFKREKLFAVTMYMVKKMLDQKLMTAAQYNEIRQIMIEKYHPVTGALFYEEAKDNEQRD